MRRAKIEKGREVQLQFGPGLDETGLTRALYLQACVNRLLSEESSLRQDPVPKAEPSSI